MDRLVIIYRVWGVGLRGWGGSALDAGVTFQKSWNGWNRRTMWSRVLSGRSISKRLRLFASVVQ
ncbi:hypothetical protein Hanom_Chr13g01204031 [Helianthus anomalus]